ncbi:recombinase family protein [Arthrobacter cheniae]|uniref:recombinase family protein n=1 Tax=Arthrobacter cheniae TaxID=1258888 RepID=UPI001F2DE0A9|nr:recombinase family protein [Arthrobacter cheniae]
MKPYCLRAGDTLVVTKLDHLRRSVRNLKEVVDGLEKQGVTSASDSTWKGDDTGLPTVSPNADQQSPSAYIGSGPPYAG